MSVTVVERCFARNGRSPHATALSRKLKVFDDVLIAIADFGVWVNEGLPNFWGPLFFCP